MEDLDDKNTFTFQPGDRVRHDTHGEGIVITRKPGTLVVLFGVKLRTMRPGELAFVSRPGHAEKEIADMRRNADRASELDAAGRVLAEMRQQAAITPTKGTL